jgi:HK97 family phage prohead protease
VIEHRTNSNRPEWRDSNSSNETANALISGHAAVFDQETVIDMAVFAFREQLARGAFKDAIRTDDVRALFNHDPNYLLGRSRNKTLRLTEDHIGLRYEATPPKTQAAEDVRELIRNGFVSGSSFAFTTAEGDDSWDDSQMATGKLPLRTIHRVRTLLDVSLVTYPAYAGTDAAREVE